MLENVREKLSNSTPTPIQWLVASACILMVRFFLESLSNPSLSGMVASDAPTLVHYFLFFLSVGLALMLLLQFVLPTWKKASPQLILLGLSITSLPPIIDWVISGGKGLVMTYLIKSPADTILSFLTFFGTDIFHGATIGIRVEVAIVIIGVGFIVYCVRKRIAMALFAMVMTYMIIFVAGSMPGIIAAIASLVGDRSSTAVQFIQSSVLDSVTLSNNIHSTLRYATLVRMMEIGFDFLIGRVFYIITIGLSLAWFFTNYKEQVRSIFSNLRPERVGHYIFLVLLGVLIAYRQSSFVLNWNDWLSLLILLLAFFFSCMYAISVNDVADVDIDNISNKGRPIPSGAISQYEMSTVGILFLVSALVAGYLSGYFAFFCILAFNALYYIYSAPLTRFKRVPGLSAFIIGLCCLSAVLAGYFTFSSVKLVSSFPPILIVGIVSIFFLAQHIKDLKDIEGDRAEGIMTIPTIFGPLWGGRIVGILTAASYFIVPFIANNPALYFGAFPAAAATYMIATRKPFREMPIFIVYGLFAIFLVVVLVIKI